MAEAYEEWFKLHPEHLPPVLSYLVPSLTSTSLISRSAADSLKALCDICRTKLVAHIGAFAQLHDKLGDLGVSRIAVNGDGRANDSPRNKSRSSRVSHRSFKPCLHLRPSGLSKFVIRDANVILY